MGSNQALVVAVSWRVSMKRLTNFDYISEGLDYFLEHKSYLDGKVLEVRVPEEYSSCLW